MSKIILLLKRQLFDNEKDTLEKFLAVTYFNDRVHLDRPITELISACDVLVIPMTDEPVKNWYEAHKINIDYKTVHVILLERQGVKICKDKHYGESSARKFIPNHAKNKAQMIQMLLASHLPSVRPWYKRLWAFIVHNFF